MSNNTVNSQIVNPVYGVNGGSLQTVCPGSASFANFTTTTFTYFRGDSEKAGYEGNLLTKLNKWVYNKNSTDYLNWITDPEKGYPILDFEE